ncbi:MAG: SDR family oxidoreductase [Pseudomonadota bacterium]
MTDLTGDCAIVTGASSGFGREFAKALAAAGAKVVCAARRVDRLEDLVGEITSAGGEAAAIAFDAMDPEGAEGLMAATEAVFGTPTVLINNAGINLSGRAHEQTPDEYDQIMTINVKTPWRLSQLCAHKWIAAAKQAGEGGAPRPGRIVNISSIASMRVLPGLSVYCISKAAIKHMTAAHAREWARFGIRVNALCPGYFRTEINDFHWETDAGKAELAKFPRRRIGEAAELNRTLLFMVDPQNDYMNGEALVVDDAQGLAM